MVRSKNLIPANPRPCEYPKCTNFIGRHGARGYCSLHYKRWKAHDGDVDYPRPNYKLTNDQKNEIFRRFVNGEKTKDLSLEFGVNVPNIHKISKNRGAPLKMRGRHKIRINKDAFSIITPESAYWIGFMITDGCVSNNKICIGLATVDKGHVEKFKNFLNSDHKIHYVAPKKGVIKQTGQTFNSTGSYHFGFTSKKVAADLAKYGVVPRKSLIAKVIGLENNRDFWRGVIDGDGCVAIVKSRKLLKPRLILVGSEPLLNQFKEFIHTHYQDCKATVRKIKGNNICELHLAEKASICIIKELYGNSSTYLDRKYEKAMKIIS